MPRGGFRPGSGRKVVGLTPKTKSIRVSPEDVHYYKVSDALLALIKRWELSAAASPTSPRWSRARLLLSELRALFPADV